VPQPGFNRHERAARTQEARGLGKAGAERTLERKVVQDETVKDYVE
jgi:hypothetical protein